MIGSSEAVGRFRSLCCGFGWVVLELEITCEVFGGVTLYVFVRDSNVSCRVAAYCTVWCGMLFWCHASGNVLVYAVGYCFAYASLAFY